MFVFQVLATVLLIFSAACFFGPQLVIYGPRAFFALSRRREARFVAGFLVTVMGFIALAPTASDALVSGGETLLAMALETATLSFGLI
jgi:hypothetical protein